MASSDSEYWMNRTDLPMEMRLYNSRNTDSTDNNAAQWATVNQQVYNAVRRGGGGYGYGSQMSPNLSAYQWDPLNTRPTAYNEQNMEYWNDLLQSIKPAPITAVTWGTAEDQELRQDTQKLARPYINAYLKDINDYNARMIGQMGYVNPHQSKYAMSAKTGQLGSNIDKTIATSSTAARIPIQQRLDAQNQANAQSRQGELMAYQALLNSLKGRG